VGEKKNAYRLFFGKPKRKSLVGIILGWMLERWDVVMWTELVCLRIGTNGELL
jgi:hypothetical protein